MHMNKSNTITMTLCLGTGLLAVPSLAEQPLRITTDTTTVTILAGDKPLVRYRYADVPFKPYADQLFTPAGINILRDSPSDHKHHHGLMFAVAADGVNYWEEKEESSGRQIHQDLSSIAFDTIDSFQRARFTETLVWTPPGSKKPSIREIRTIQALRSNDLKATLITWTSRMELLPDIKQASLTGSNYFGLGSRFLASMDKDGTFILPDGKATALATNDTRAPWCAYTAVADGKPVTIAMFDHPDNPRHPANWFTMNTPFAYLSATLDLDNDALALDAGKPLVIQYGVALWDGKASPESINKLYGTWVPLKTAK